MKIGSSMRRRVQVSQVRDDGSLDRAVAWSHLKGTFIGTGLFVGWGVRKRKG